MRRGGGAVLSRQDLAEIGARYEQLRPDFERVTLEVSRIVSDELRRHAIKHMTTARAKWRDSLERKLWKERDRFAVGDLERSLTPQLKDLAGVRVLLYVPQDVEAAVLAVKQRFPACEARWTPKSIKKAEGYCAEHVYVDLLDVHPKDHAEFGRVLELPCEVQICTISSHIWNELEHDIVYKQPSGRPDEGQRELLASLHQELGLATATVARLIARTNERARENREPMQGPPDLRRYLEHRFKRSLAGDFAALLDLLESLVDDVTPTFVDRLFEEGVREEEARRTAEILDLDQAQADVGTIAVMLLPGLGRQDVVDVVTAKPDVPSLWKFLRRAAENGGR